MTATVTLTVDELRLLEETSMAGDAVRLLVMKPAAEGSHWVTITIEEKEAAHA